MKPIEVIYDIELFPNRLCVAYQKGDDKIKVEDDLSKILNIPFNNPKYLFVGFNIRRYDQPILEALMSGDKIEQLYQLSYDIIQTDLNVYSYNTNIVDLYEICPKLSKTSLKGFGHRFNYPILQNLPYDPQKILSDKEWEDVKNYSHHDIKITKLLWEKLKPEYKVRQSLKRFFNIKTEFGGAPNLAAKAILSELGNTRLSYDTQTLIKMDNLKLSDEMKAYYDEATDLSFKDYKDLNFPSMLKGAHYVKGCKLNIKLGGLHGVLRPGYYKNVYEYDVVSYYPSIILNCKIGSDLFRKIYKKIYDRRLALKKANSPDAESLKLVLNSIYGKLSDKWADSRIFSPNLGLSICLLGQFYIIDLIEKLENEEVLFANTDGVIVKTPIKESVLKEWEERTGFKMKIKAYKDFILKDVNSYYAQTPEGLIERKKEFRERQWTHNVKATIIQKIIVDYFLKGAEPLLTVFKGESIDYCFFVRSKGELMYDGELLGDKKVRYYCSTNGGTLESVHDEKRHIKVQAKTPVTLYMNTDDKIDNINYDWYVKEALKIIKIIEGG